MDIHVKKSKKPMLSKSRFIAGRQCPHRLWNQCFNREKATPPSLSQQAAFDAGHKFGRLARTLYHDGILIRENYLRHRQAEQKTAILMNDENVPAIFEAAFTFDSVRIRVDILERAEGGRWNLIEAKNSSSVSDVFKADLQVQYYVLNGAGLIIAKACILHRKSGNGSSEYSDGDFQFADLTDEALNNMPKIVKQVADLKEVIATTNPPNIIPSDQCLNPYRCEFIEYCRSTEHQNG
jgi:hypothetical protein